MLMAQVEEYKDGEKIQTSTPMSNFSRDLLQRFISASHLPVKLDERNDDADADAEELELTLGLSMNGRFGVDPRAKKIKRTSSIPEFLNPVRDENGMAYVTPMACTPLMRTCSLPTETEEEWRKRKELQTLRRMEARRKRSEKQRNLKALREKNQAFSEEIVVGNNQPQHGTVSTTLNESQGISEFECQRVQGTKYVDVDSRSIIDANSIPNEQLLPVIISATRTAESSVKIATETMRNWCNKPLSHANRTEDIKSNSLEDMPCVSTKGDGPNGKRIEGFLYRCGKGEEVRIMCVCHGSFLTPAEFVKHAGGGDVEHPLKHIVVSPTLV